MHSLEGDDAIMPGAERFRDLLPRPAPLSLFADKLHERFQAAVKGASAAGPGSPACRCILTGFHIHRTPAYRVYARFGQRAMGGLSGMVPEFYGVEFLKT